MSNLKIDRLKVCKMADNLDVDFYNLKRLMHERSKYAKMLLSAESEKEFEILMASVAHINDNIKYILSI